MGASEQAGEEVCLGGLRVGGNYVWFLVIAVIFVRAKRWGGAILLGEKRLIHSRFSGTLPRIQEQLLSHYIIDFGKCFS